MPWDKKDKDQVLLSVGALEAWIQSKKPDNQFTYDKLWLRNYKSQAITILWTQSLGLLAVGCDSGMLDIISVNVKTPAEYTEIYKEKVHTARIMGIAMDSTRKLVYTIGEDRFLRCLDLELLQVTSECKVSSHKLTSLKVNPEGQVAYIADRKGQIHIYDLTHVKNY